MKSNLNWKSWAIALLVAVFSGMAVAQAPAAKPAPEPDLSKYKVVIGTGGQGGTYDTMVGKELMGQCRRDETTFGVVNRDGGTLANIDMILANKQDAGAGQEDVLFLKKATNPEVNQLKTLITLHPEEVHVFVRVDTGLFGADVVTSKYMGLKEQRTKGEPIVFNSIEDLNGARIAAWGGSFDTARLIKANSGINYTPVQVKNMADAFAALDKGEVQAVLAVAGAPAANFEGLSEKYKLVGFKEETVQKLVAIYNGGAILNYTNLRSEGVKTISTNAILFTREFNDPEILRALADLRACATTAVIKLKDTRGAHKKWKQVNVTSKGKWPNWYELPAAGAVKTSTKK